MEDLLRSEGIKFTKDGLVDMEKHLWKPKSTNQKSESRNKRTRHR